MKNLWSITLVLTLMITVGCSADDELSEIAEIDLNSPTLTEILADDNLISAKHPQPPIYADCDKYTGLVVPATFKPESDPFDELYGGLPEGHSFKDGYPLISDSRPGDQDYNGGRWHMNLYVGQNPEAYADACSEEDIHRISYENGWNMNDFMSTDSYFGCPLKKVKGN